MRGETMKKKYKDKIVVRDVYDFHEVVAMLPFGAEYIYDVRVENYGYVHDVGVIITLTKKVGVDASGWDTLRADFDECVKFAKWAWRTAAEYGYH